MSAAATDINSTSAASPEELQPRKAENVSSHQLAKGDAQRSRKLAPKPDYKRQQPQKLSTVANIGDADTSGKCEQGSEVDRSVAKDQKSSQNTQSLRGLQDVETRGLYKACCEQLRTACKGHTSSQISYVTCVLTVTLNSFRALKRAELDHAVHLYLGRETEGPLSSAPENQQDKVPDRKRLGSVDTLVREDPNGGIVFVLPALASFLKIYRVAGIDPTHRTIAGICILQQKFDAKSRGRSDENGNLERKIVVESPFSAYAEEYGNWHIREVSRQGLRL